MELEPIREALWETIVLRMGQVGIVAEPAADGVRRFDDGFAALCRHDPAHYRVVLGVLFQELPRSARPRTTTAFRW